MFPPGVLESFGLYLVRTSALVLASPLSGNTSAVSSYKISLIVSLALLSAFVGGSPVPADFSPFDYGLWALREVLIGLSMSFVLHLVIMAVRVSSDLIGQEMAFTISSVVDPQTGVNTPLISRIYELLFLLALLGVNGHHWLFQALARSYERAPVGRADYHEGLPSFVVQVFGELFSAGLSFAAPIIVLLLLVSVLIGILARAVPQLNILEFGFSMRIVVGLGAMCLFAPLLAPAMEALLNQLMDGLDRSLDALTV